MQNLVSYLIHPASFGSPMNGTCVQQKLPDKIIWVHIWSLGRQKPICSSKTVWSLTVRIHRVSLAGIWYAYITPLRCTVLTPVDTGLYHATNVVQVHNPCAHDLFLYCVTSGDLDTNTVHYCRCYVGGNQTCWDCAERERISMEMWLVYFAQAEGKGDEREGGHEYWTSTFVVQRPMSDETSN